MRLQPSQHQIPPCEGWRQADDARLWYRHARICCVRRCERGRLRSTGNRVSPLLTRLSAYRLVWSWHDKAIRHKTAIFRQINREKVVAHHDALEFPDGQIVLLTCLSEGQQATVLQLPAEPKTAAETEVLQRAACGG